MDVAFHEGFPYPQVRLDPEIIEMSSASQWIAHGKNHQSIDNLQIYTTHAM